MMLKKTLAQTCNKNLWDLRLIVGWLALSLVEQYDQSGEGGIQEPVLVVVDYVDQLAAR